MIRQALVLAALLITAPPAWAQTAAELFDDSQLHTLEIVIHTRDWADLRAHFDSETITTPPTSPGTVYGCATSACDRVA